MLLDKSDLFLQLGYNTLLVDFMGSGGSEGNQTSVGFFEAEEVKTCYDYVKRQSNAAVFLFGTSMGAVAMLKAIRDDAIAPDGILLECPFWFYVSDYLRPFSQYGSACFSYGFITGILGRCAAGVLGILPPACRICQIGTLPCFAAIWRTG